MNLRVRRQIAWIALLVMLLGALAPTMSHALALTRAGTSGLQAVCTTSGVRWVPAPAVAATTGAARSTLDLLTNSPAGQESVPDLTHCPFCLPIADRLGPPPAASLHFFKAESGLAPPDVQALFFPLLTLSPALPRGPPSHA